MKKILLVFLLVSIPLFAQQFDKSWDKVIAFENEGKIKSTNEIVSKIHTKAVADNDEVQIIKCFFYESKYLQVVDENAQTKILNNLKREIERVSIPSKAILNLIYAKCVNDYRLNFETAMAVVDTAAVFMDTTAVAIDTISIDTNDSAVLNDSLNKLTDLSDSELSLLFLKTLENETVLKNTSLSKYKTIFNPPTLDKLKKENLLYYILRENIAFFTHIIEEWEIESNDFIKYQDVLLGSSEDFVKLNLDFVKYENLKKLLTLFQKQEINTPTIDSQLERMQFCHSFILEDDDNYMKALDLLQTKTNDTYLLQKIQLEKAGIYANQASKEKNKDYNIRALIILDTITATVNNSITYQLAMQKKQSIKEKSVEVRLQKFIYPNENTRALVSYKNVDEMKISFYKINHKTILNFENEKISSDSLVTQIIKNQVFKSTQQPLENRHDYFEYTMEILLPQLETGSYLMYFESDSDTKNQKAFAYETITVSNLSMLASNINNETFYSVLDRKSGKPLENVRIQSALFDIKTNAKGIASFISASNNYDDESLTLSTLNDTIRFEKNYLYNSKRYQNENEENYVYNGKVELYLDRAIYRPGQTVYYKGIAIKNRNDKNSIVANTTFKLRLKNASNETLKELEVSTNEFGSFSGEFVLPITGLTGDFRIEADRPDDYKKDIVYDKIKAKHPFWENVNLQYNAITFKVEEYKRPNFEILFEPKKESFHINQTIKIKGIAKAFSGSSISDVKVIYTVNRFTSYYRNYNDTEQNEVITTEETKTDASGNFVIYFAAKPSPNAKKEQFPVFNYRINLFVTDSNGETHSAETTVKVGYHDLILKANIPSEIETKNKNEIILNSTNLNGEFLATKGEIKLYFIRAISSKFKSRVWGKPEIETISNEDFNRLFPYENNEKPLSEKELGTLVYSKNIDTEKDKTIPLDFISDYKAGRYKVVFSATDSFDNPIETSADFQLIQSKDKFIPNQFITITQLNENPKKDGFVKVKISSAIPELYINTIGNYKNQLFYEKNIHLINNEAIVVIPVKETFKNTVALGFETIFENQPFNIGKKIALKENVPNLEFETSSFRNKIEPGSLEKWSFQLKSNNTTKEAEILASMYDSSLDQFTKTEWNGLSFYEYHYNDNNFKKGLGFETTYSNLQNLNTILKSIDFQNKEHSLKWFGFNFCKNTYEQDTIADVGLRLITSAERIKGDADAVLNITEVRLPPPPKVDQVKFVKPALAKAEEITFGKSNNRLYIIDGEIVSDDVYNNLDSSQIVGIEELAGTKAIALYGSNAANGVIIITTKKTLEALTQVKARINLSETAFFYPNLKTDAKGNLSFNFTSPEALTAWKLRLLAHNKEAVTGYLEKTVITQKELMVVPNFPRFFREKDSIVITAKVANMTNEPKTGIAVLQLFDATTMQTIDAKMANINTVKNFNIAAFGNTTVSWKIYIPEGLQGVQYKVLAKAGNYSDGEENILPVLTNSMLVTESIPIWVRENSKKEYTFENLKNNTSTTLRNHQFTLEYTSNPSWIAIQSLPYLMEFEHECAEQTFARFYSNALASEIISSNPKIASLFETWRKNGKLNSKLEENDELKSMILAETPWLNDAQNEDEKKKNLALLFDLEKMKTSQEATFDKLEQKQKPSGGFAWFDGSEPNEYITRHILAGLGHLSKLSSSEDSKAKIKQITSTGIPFIDQKFLETYKRNRPKTSDKLIWTNPYSDLHYLYTRSFYLDNYPLSDTLKKATTLYLETTKKDWLTYSLYEKGLAALTLNRFGEKDAAKKIIESLKETASNNEDWGMYWIANKSGWYWYQAPIETQALLIEAFAEVTNDTKSVDAMKVWLLKNKQTKSWPTTKSTTEAIYALLMQGTDWLSVKDNTIIKIGDEKILTKKLAENEKEAETGYIKLNWKADEINKNMARISIENKSKVPGFGGVYWQYFEDLDKIKTNSGGVLSVAKELYLKKSNDKGELLEKITSKNNLRIGDLVTVRLLITAKEDMEFVHLKDMRASCFEPVDVLSGYEYKSGLGFYKSTKDAATHFFFDKLNKGTYVLEYDIRVNNKGEFSNGITTIESMYAPEFSSHTKGIRVQVR